jgi:hypothetical protein
MSDKLKALDFPLHAGLDILLEVGLDAKVRFKTIRNNSGKVVLLVAHHVGDDDVQDHVRNVIIHSVNNHITSPAVRGSDVVQSQKAAKRPKNMGTMRKQAYGYYLQHGAMTDERLWEYFVEGQISITPDRVRHLRLELVLMEMIEQYHDLVGKTESGMECRVFGIKKAHAKMMTGGNQ